MELQKQVASLELAKQLKELGVKQDSLFYWKLNEGITPRVVTNAEDIKKMEELIPVTSLWYSAFTVAELGEMLPWEIVFVGENDDEPYNLFIEKLDTVYRVYYLMRFEAVRTPEFDAETEADARAKMLIWLIENKYLSTKESAGKDGE